MVLLHLRPHNCYFLLIGAVSDCSHTLYIGAEPVGVCKGGCVVQSL